MEKIGLVINPNKPDVLTLTKQVIDWFKLKGIGVLVERMGALSLERPELSLDTDSLNSCDCIIVLGGDGTLLNTARSKDLVGVPMFGINFGHLGFLTELEINDVIPALEKLVAGDYHLEERMMIEATVIREGQELEKFIALNDAVITKGAFSRIIKMDTYIDGKFYDTFPADGLIFSTSTGSTAYSLSAGGPLVMPDLDLMVVIPICPHTLYARPLVIQGGSTVRTIVRSEQGEVMLTLDGQNGFSLQHLDEIIIEKAESSTKLVKLNNRTFFEILREKMKEGGTTDV